MNKIRNTAVMVLSGIWICSIAAVGLMGLILVVAFWMPLSWLITVIEPDMKGH